MIVGDGPDRERLEQLASGLNGQVEFAGRVDDERLADLYARCLAVYYAPRRRGLRDGAVRGVPLRQAGRDDARRRRPARGRPRRRDRARRRARARRARAGLRVPRRVTSTRRRRRARPGRRSPSASPGTPASTRCCREGRLLLAAAAVALGDRRLLGAAPAGAPRARSRRSSSPSRASARPPRTSRSTTSATTPTPTAGSSTRCASGPASSSCTSYVLHHLIAGITIGRGNGRGYLDAMERDFGVAGRLLGLGVLDNLLPLLWETQPERFPLTGVVLDLARGLIVHSHYVERPRPRPPATRGALWRIPHPVWPPRDVEPAADVGGDAADRLLRPPEHEQADPAAARGVRARCARRLPGARLLLVGAAAERFDLDRRLERLGLGRRRAARRTTCPRSGCGR